MSSESEMNGVFNFTWTIENYFSFPAKNGEGITSPVFIENTMSGREWYVKLYPDGRNELNKGYINCSLNRTTYFARTAVDVCCSIELIDSFGEVLRCVPMNKVSLKINEVVNCEKLLENSRLLENSKYSLDDSLIVRWKVKSGTTTKIPECAALTKIGVNRCSFKLLISSFESSTLLAIKKFFCSDEFQFEIGISAREDYFSINIYKTRRCSLRSFFLICKITLLALDGVETISRSASHWFENDNWEFVSFLKKSMLKEEASKYLSNDSFTLLCDFSIPNGTTLTEIKYIHDKYPIDSDLNMKPVKKVDSVPNANSVKMVDSALFTDSHKVLRDDFRNLYISHENSDVKLQADSETFPAHKLVLSARSPVFRAMFGQDMVENQTGIVNISDIDAKSLNYLLGFIYSGTVDILSYETGLKLLVAADKYQVLSLKDECSTYLMTILSLENVCEIVVVADRVGHALLKSSAVDYIKAHASKILPTVEWKQCVKENTELATEILYKLSVDFEKDK